MHSESTSLPLLMIVLVLVLKELFGHNNWVCVSEPFCVCNFIFAVYQINSWNTKLWRCFMVVFLISNHDLTSIKPLHVDWGKLIEWDTIIEVLPAIYHRCSSLFIVVHRCSSSFIVVHHRVIIIVLSSSSVSTSSYHRGSETCNWVWKWDPLRYRAPPNDRCSHYPSVRKVNEGVTLKYVVKTPQIENPDGLCSSNKRHVVGEY